MIIPFSYPITYNSPWDELFLCPFSMWKIHVGIILLPFQFEENTSQFDIFLILYRKYWHELMKSKKGFYNMHTMIQFQYVCHCMLDVNGLLGKIILHANVHFSTIIR